MGLCSRLSADSTRFFLLRPIRGSAWAKPVTCARRGRLYSTLCLRAGVRAVEEGALRADGDGDRVDLADAFAQQPQALGGKAGEKSTRLSTRMSAARDTADPMAMPTSMQLIAQGFACGFSAQVA